MKNRSVTLLALLAANHEMGQQSVHRTMLVKQLFLVEIIRPVYDLWIQTFGFIRYHYGPYSDDIFNRLDVLIFHNLVKVNRAERRPGRYGAQYEITENGQRLLKEIHAPQIKELTMDLVWALQAIGVEKSGTICKLVYQESEFARLFAEHSPETRMPLPIVTTAGNETFVQLATLQELQRQNGIQGDRSPLLLSREVIRLFLLFLVARVPTARTRRAAE
jgi:DNA-binding PadR family transcriptional regulator